MRNKTKRERIAAQHNTASSAHQVANDIASRLPASRKGAIVRYGNKADSMAMFDRSFGASAAIRDLGLE